LDARHGENVWWWQAGRRADDRTTQHTSKRPTRRSVRRSDGGRQLRRLQGTAQRDGDGVVRGHEYYFAVYEFNGATTPNTGRATNRWRAATPCRRNGEQASSVYVTGTNETTLTGITLTDGNGASRLVLAKAAGAVDAFPTDGMGYTNSATFGSGTQIGTGNYVVHAGSGPLATLSGLSRDVVYHFRVFEFNGSGVTANYNTNSAAGNPPVRRRWRARGIQPHGFDPSAIGTNGFTVSWTKGTTGTNT
jgi:hypothetical protein